MEFDATEVGILYCIVLLATLPGACFTFWLAEKVNPLRALQLQLTTFMGINFGAFLWLTGPSRKIEAHICAVGWGFCLGMYYPLTKAIYAMIIPRGQETELAGFYKYCSQVLSWAPPLVFTIINESGINLNWSGMSLNVFLSLGLVCFMRTKPWDECLEDAKVNRMPNMKGLNADKNSIRSDKV
jgi:UMF1 family MFS transporter